MANKLPNQIGFPQCNIYNKYSKRGQTKFERQILNPRASLTLQQGIELKIPIGLHKGLATFAVQYFLIFKPDKRPLNQHYLQYFLHFKVEFLEPSTAVVSSIWNHPKKIYLTC